MRFTLATASDRSFYSSEPHFLQLRVQSTFRRAVIRGFAPLFLEVFIQQSLAVGFTIDIQGKETDCDYFFRHHVVRKMPFQMIPQAFSQILFTFDKKENEMTARFASVHCSNHLFVVTKYASVKFDFFKLYPVAVNFYLGIDSPQIQKIVSLVDFA